MNSSLKTSVAALIACGCTVLLAPLGQAALPAPVLPAAPSPLPALPGAFGAFTPDVTGTAPPANVPCFAEWTRNAIPGDTVVMTGTKLSSRTDAGVGRDVRFTAYGQSGATGVTAEANVQRLSGDQLALTLPASLPSGSVYLVWGQNEAGTGRPAILNRTEGWWVGPGKANPGAVISVFGRNLGSGTSSWMYLQGPTGTGQWLTATSCNGYKATFTLPAGLATGAYKVWPHNGLGQQYGWSKYLDLTVTAPYVWTATQFNVVTYGAVGNGIADDTAAINAAITASGLSPGSSVIFPAGTYLTSTTIGGARSNMRWIGAGKALTKIIAKPAFADDYGMFIGSFTNVEISGMTFDTGGSMGGVLGNSIFQIRTSSGVRFTDVRFTQEKDPATLQSSPVDFQSSDYVFFTNCDFVESQGSFPGNSKQVFFDNCTFAGINDCNALLYIWGGAQISLTNSTAADYNAADVRANGNGWAQGRWISGRGGYEGAPSNIYFAGNTTTNLMVRPAYSNQNTGEQFMFEGLEAIYRGQASGGSATTVTVSAPGSATGMVVTVVGGKGIGQSRRILSAGGGTVTVDQAWNVIPDSTSLVSVGGYLNQVAVISNTFDGKPAAAIDIPNYTATTGVEPYGGAVNIVVAGNTFHDLRNGVYNWALSNSTGSQNVLQPNFFNDYSGNTFTNCLYGIRNSVGHWDAPALTADMGLLGNTFRRNNVSAVADGISFWSTGIGATPPTAAMNLFQTNTVSAVRAWQSDQLLGMLDPIVTGNQMTSSGTVGAQLNIAQRPALRDNTWTQPGSSYSGTPTGILEVPRRYAAHAPPSGTPTATGSFTVWNSGTGSLAWTATTATTWLSLTSASGTIPNEGSAGAFNYTATTTGLTAGDYVGVISVTGGGKTQQVSVLLTVAAIPPPVYGTGTGLKGQYYAGVNMGTLIQTQTDPVINFNWGNGSPTSLNGSSMGSIGPDNFSVRWTGQIQAVESGSYKLTTTTDDGVRLWITDTNGTPVIDQWVNQTSTSWDAFMTLVAGTKYNIRLEYYDGTGPAEAKLAWVRPGGGAAQIVPQTQLYPAAAVTNVISREVWTNFDGNDVSAIPIYWAPNIVDTLTSLEGPTDWADKYGTRLRGYIQAPTTGTYTFWIAGDDSTELWLSTNTLPANKAKIASSISWTNSREWNKMTSQKSANISLVAGQKYYVEVLQKEGSGGDNLAVGWLKPGQTGTVPSEVVPGSVLSPFL